MQMRTFYAGTVGNGPPRPLSGGCRCRR